MKFIAKLDGKSVNVGEIVHAIALGRNQVWHWYLHDDKKKIIAECDKKPHNTENLIWEIYDEQKKSV